VNHFARYLLCALLVACREDGGPPDPSEVSTNLSVITSTTGEGLDPDGYLAGWVDTNTDPAHAGLTPVGLNDTIVYAVFPGRYRALLRGIAGNCTVADSTREVAVTDPFLGYQARFNISCR
jgi:hypothetical protein